MTVALIALVIAVAFEAAVIVGLALRLRAYAGRQQRDTPRRFEWEEPMDWDEPKTTINRKDRRG